MNFTTSGKRFVGCYYIIRFTNDIIPIKISTLNETPITQTSCTECLINNNNYFYLTSCDLSGERYPFNIGDLPTGSTINDAFYVDFTYNGRPFTGCYYIISFGNEVPTIISVLINQSGQTDCATCYADNPFIYLVTPCVGVDIVYVSLPNDNYVNHLITYFDLDQQFCGVVEEISVQQPTVTFIADLGEYLDPQQCQDCVDQVADKKIITNCLTNIDEVV
jgi:hypothetical protein